MVSVKDVSSNLYHVNFKEDTRQQSRQSDPPMLVRQQQLQNQADRFEKERKKQQRKNNIIAWTSVAASLTLIFALLFPMLRKGGASDSLRNQAEKEAVKIKRTNTSELREHHVDTYSEEVKSFLNRIDALLRRSDVEAKGGARITQVQLGGPGGTGKTEVAGSIAKKVEELFPGSEYYVPDLSMLSSSSWAGQNVHLLSEYTAAIDKRAGELALDSAKTGKKKYLVCFLDEFDKIAMESHGPNKDLSNDKIGALKTLINSLMEHDNVILLSATNYPELIEGAVSSRVSEKIMVDFLTPKQTATAIVEHYLDKAKKEMVSKEFLEFGNEKLNAVCDIISGKNSQMEFRKLKKILQNTWIKSPENKPIELKHLVEAAIDKSTARDLNLSEKDIAALKSIVGL